MFSLYTMIHYTNIFSFQRDRFFLYKPVKPLLKQTLLTLLLEMYYKNIYVDF